MANQQHLDLLNQGKIIWNKWRKQNRDLQPDLFQANLQGANLHGVNFSRVKLNQAVLTQTNLSNSNMRNACLIKADLYQANLCEVTLSHANLCRAHLSEAVLRGANLCQSNLRESNLQNVDLSQANLSNAALKNAILYKSTLRNAVLCNTDLRGANLCGTDLTQANLRDADLRGANLSDANLSQANLTGVNLRGANLSRVNLEEAKLLAASLIDTNLNGANLVGCFIYGVSVWKIHLDKAIQRDLVVTLSNESRITVDNLEVAQFIYLLLNNKKIRDIIDTITSKVVLILGRFAPKRKDILEGIRNELRKQNYLPVLFDFDQPKSRDITETVTLLARLSRFIIADLTDPRSIPQELDSIVPTLPSVPVQPILESSQHVYGMYEHFTRYPWVLPTYLYTDEVSLLDSLKEHIIEPAEQKAKQLMRP